MAGLAATNAHVSHTTAVLSLAKAGVPHRRAHPPLVRLGSGVGVVVQHRLDIGHVTSYIRFRSGAVHASVDIVLPVAAIISPFAESSRLVRQTDLPLPQAGEPEVGRHGSLRQPKVVLFVVVVSWTPAKPSVTRSRGTTRWRRCRV